jgi:hypothetical protein
MAKSNFKEVMRDANDTVCLSPINLISDGDMAPPLGVVFPYPSEPSRPFSEGFCMTQIVVVSNFDFYWELRVNVDALGNVANPKYKKLHGVGLGGLIVNIPYTGAIDCEPNTFINLLIDTMMGAPVPGGNTRFEIYGHYNKQVPRTV